MRELRGVGYWRDIEQTGEGGDGPELPQPDKILQALGACAVDSRVVDYLRAGRSYFSTLGCSYCRLRCGIPDEEMGSRDLTDGSWVWPEGLVHYVEVHGLPLPEAFVATMEENHWQVPQVEGLDRLWQEGFSLDYWLQWCQRVTAR